MKKNALKKMLACTMALAMLTASGVTVCKYAVYYQLANGAENKPWTVLQNYSTNTQVIFTPDQKDIYKIRINAKSPDGTIAKSEYIIDVQ